MDPKNNSTSDQSGNTSTPISMKKEIPFIIPAEGSLGLLALGDVGVKAWRKVRDEAKKSAKK